MVYLSQILNKDIYHQKRVYGKLIDVAVLENYPIPSLSKIVIKRAGKKLTINPSVIKIINDHVILTSEKTPFLPYDESDFYLNEDLLDKQVIDIHGKRLVRVNDIALESNGETKIIGIDIGAAGIFRRLHLGGIIRVKPKILPWDMIEAFDYQTGNIKLKLTEKKVNDLHPSELADILEEAGSKERIGILNILDTKKAAQAIEETDTKTQEAILEQLPLSPLKKIVNRMHLSEIADIFYKLNPLRIREILKILGSEKAEKIQKLLAFGNDTAGGLMNLNFFSVDSGKSVKEIKSYLTERTPKPEMIVVTNGSGKYVGMIPTKELIDCDNLAIAKDIIAEKKFTYPNANLYQIIKIFSHYNLRTLPVVDKDKKPLGIIKIDSILSRIEEEEEEKDVVL